jgi:hypothetical protein
MTAIFKDTTEALIFAFRFPAEQYTETPHAKMIKAGIVGSGKGMVALDGAAQAGMILAQVDQLAKVDPKMGPYRRSCIVARYCRRVEECKCCGGEAITAQYREAIANLAEGWVSSQITGLTVRGMRHAYVRSFFERGVSIKEEADRHNVAKSTAYDQKSVVWGKLQDLDLHAQREIADRLEPLCGFEKKAA